MTWLSPPGMLLHSSYSIFSHPAPSKTMVCYPYPDIFNNPLNQKKASRLEQVSQVAMPSERIRKSRALSCCLQLKSAPMPLSPTEQLMSQMGWGRVPWAHLQPSFPMGQQCLPVQVFALHPAPPGGCQAALRTPLAIEQHQGDDSTGDSSAWAVSCFTMAKTNMCFQSTYFTNAGEGQRMRGHYSDIDLA